MIYKLQTLWIYNIIIIILNETKLDKPHCSNKLDFQIFMSEINFIFSWKYDINRLIIIMATNSKYGWLFN